MVLWLPGGGSRNLVRSCQDSEYASKRVNTRMRRHNRYVDRTANALVEIAAQFYGHLQKLLANFCNTWKIQGPCMDTFCRITVQLSLFELKLKTFPLLTTAITLFSRVSFASKFHL